MAAPPKVSRPQPPGDGPPAAAPKPAAKPPRIDPKWSIMDRVGLGLSWAAGISLCVVAATIVGYMAYKGLQYVTFDMITQSPEASLDQSSSGGFLDPILGTLLLTTIGIVIAVPIGVATAVWLTEYGRPAPLARAVESGVEIVAGTPSIVLAIFGLLIFQQTFMGLFSFTAEGGSVFGRSFITAGVMMSLVAIPMVIGATREALMAIPRMCARPRTHSARTRRPPSAGSCFRARAPASPPVRPSAWDALPVTRRSWSSCSAPR